MGSKNKQNGEAESEPCKEEDAGAEGEDSTDDEGAVDTPPPQKDEEDAADEDGTFEVEQIVDMECRRRWKCPVKFRVRWVGYSEKDDTWLPASELNCEDLIKEFLEISGRSFEYKAAMAPKKRASDGGEMTMQTRKAMRFSYSELDEDQDEVIPAGTRSRKVKAKPEPKPPKPATPRKRYTYTARPVGRLTHKKEPEEYEVEKILNERQKRGKKEYLVQWKNKGPKHNSWEPEENLENAKDALENFIDSQKKKKKKPGKDVHKVEEVEAAPARSRRTGKNRSYSEFYNQ